ncbi:MAG: hypothetical protein WBX15_13665 [Thermoanaerobaculia bacterium]
MLRQDSSRTRFGATLAGWLVIGTSIALLGACANKNEQATTTGTDTAATSSAAATDVLPTQPSGKTKPPVEVTISDHGVDMPHTIEGGSVAFQVTNSGKELHSFAISGNGVARALDAPLQPLEVRTLVVDGLRPGTYQVMSTVGGTIGKEGETIDITVTPSSGEAPAGTDTTSTGEGGGPANAATSS